MMHGNVNIVGLLYQIINKLQLFNSARLIYNVKRMILKSYRTIKRGESMKNLLLKIGPTDIRGGLR